MEKKYLFFDIDGTLTNRATGGIVPSAKEALQRLEENGHFVAIATGRAHYKAEKFTKANGFKNMVCNGGNGLVIDEELVMNIPLEKENCIRIIEEADKKDVVVFGDDYNDMDMFHSDWLSIAMGNGCQALKEKADYVTDTNVNDGIKKACEHFGWI